MASATPKEENKGKGDPQEGTKGTKSDVTNPSFNMEELRELADLIEERGFTDFEFENERIRVRMSKNLASTGVQPVPSAPPAEAPKISESSVGEADPEMAADDGLYKINSPIVGTFYRASGPDKDPYVTEGDNVNENTIVCIVEAMKLMNEIQAETAGEIV